MIIVLRINIIYIISQSITWIRSTAYTWPASNEKEKRSHLSSAQSHQTVRKKDTDSRVGGIGLEWGDGGASEWDSQSPILSHLTISIYSPYKSIIIPTIYDTLLSTLPTKYHFPILRSLRMSRIYPHNLVRHPILTVQNDDIHSLLTIIHRVIHIHL